MVMGCTWYVKICTLDIAVCHNLLIVVTTFKLIIELHVAMNKYKEILKFAGVEYSERYYFMQYSQTAW